MLKRFKRTLRRAGVRELRFHDLRHTFGTRCAAAGVPLRTIQEWMGHRDFKTTLIYADYAPGQHEAEMIEHAFSATDAGSGGRRRPIGAHRRHSGSAEGTAASAARYPRGGLSGTATASAGVDSVRSWRSSPSGCI